MGYNYSIKCRSKESGERFGKARAFTLSPLVPLVRRRIYFVFREIIENMPEDALSALNKTKIEPSSFVLLLTRLLSYLEEKGMLEDFIACLICPVDSDERTKDVKEISEFLSLNALLALEMRIVSDFFSDTPLWEIGELFHSISKAIKIPKRRE
jgi:hypothetical protein